MKFEAMANLQVVLLLILASGWFARRLNILKENTSGQLSDILINIVLPCNIIDSFIKQEFSIEILENSLWTLAIGTAALAGAYLLGKVVYFRFEDKKKRVMQYATINSNAIFVGFPVIESVFGDIGVLYASIAIIPLRVAMWSFGLSLLAVSKTETPKRGGAFKSVMLHPCMIGVYLGFVGMLVQHYIPEFLSTTLHTISSSTTFLSMFTVGALLYGTKLKDLFHFDEFYYCLIRLVVLPCLIFLVLSLLRVDSMLRGIEVLIMAMPGGTTTAILAAKYECNASFASQIIFLSTVLSMITLPVFCLFL